MADKDRLLDHNYDGITEYDNDLPRWWVWLFWITIIWGVVYGVWFHLPQTPTPEERLAAELNAISITQDAATPKVDFSEDTVLALLKDQVALTKGKDVFTTRCMACHAAEGQGLVGPNLTDKFWIHGGTIQNIRQVILEGVPAKGMLAWKTMLTAEEVNYVLAFILSIQGTNPPNPKAPEGALYDGR